MVQHKVVASVPFFWNMAQSAWATVRTSLSASSTIRSDGASRQSPSSAWARAAASTSGWRWPRTTGPQLHMRSTYSRPSTSVTRAPWPLRMNWG